MATVSITISIVDEMNEHLNRMLDRMNDLVESVNRLNKAMERLSRVGQVTKNIMDNSTSITVVNQQFVHMTEVVHQNYQQINQTINQQNVLLAQTNHTINQQNVLLNQTNNSINQSAQSQQNLNKSIGLGQRLLASMWGKIKGIAKQYLSLESVQKVLSAADTFIAIQTRLDFVVDEGQTAEQVKEKLYAAANRARSDFHSLFENVSNLKLQAGFAFSGTDEIIAFTELAQKAFQLGGGTAADQQAGMEQLIQAMTNGGLDESGMLMIMNQAPMLADAIAAFTGKSKSELRSMAAEGMITADILKAAIFMASDEINSKFSDLPKTFSDVWRQFQNDARRFFEPVFQRLNDWLNSPQGAAFVQTLTSALFFAAQAADALLGAFIWLIDTIQSNWGIIEPIIVTISSALAFWALNQIPMLISQLRQILKPILSAAMSWMIMNWHILLVGAIIGFLIYVFYRWGDAATEVVGFIGGLIGMFVAFVHNRIAFFRNIFAAAAEFLLNVFRHPVYSVRKLFINLANEVLDQLKRVASAIDWVFGSNLADRVSSLQNDLQQMLGEEPSDYITIDRMQTMDYDEAFRTGQAIGKSFGQSVTNAITDTVDYFSSMFQVPGLPEDSYGNRPFGDDPFGDSLFNKKGLDSIGRVDEVGKIGETVDISSEDLKIMRELAEMQAIQNFVTLQPQLTFGDTHIRQDGRSVDEIIANITARLNEEIASSARGVYTVG
jgi:tape measure domain-containing protein